MSGLGRCTIAPGLLTALLVVACTGTGAADHAPDSPESRLRARIADLHADVELMQVECAAARHNLLECLKKSGHLELGDRKTVVSKIKDEIRSSMWAEDRASVTPGDACEKLQREARRVCRIKRRQEPTLNRMAEIEYPGPVRFRSSRVGSQEGRFSQEDPIAAPEETGAGRG